MRGKQSLLFEAEPRSQTYPLQYYCCLLLHPHGVFLSCLLFLANFLDCEHWARTAPLVHAGLPVYETMQYKKTRALLQCTFPGQRAELSTKKRGGPGKVWRTFYHEILCSIASQVPYILVFVLFPKGAVFPHFSAYIGLSIMSYIHLIFVILMEEKEGRNNAWNSMPKTFLSPWITCLASRCDCKESQVSASHVPGATFTSPLWGWWHWKCHCCFGECSWKLSLADELDIVVSCVRHEVIRASEKSETSLFIDKRFGNSDNSPITWEKSR